MAFDLLESAGANAQSAIKRLSDSGNERFMMVTPKEIDLVIDRAARFIAMGINSAMQREMALEDIVAIVS